MNELFLIVPSNLKNTSDFIRFAQSVDISEKIHIFFVNQSKNINMIDVYCFKRCLTTEIKTYRVVPLAQARNLALKKIYKNGYPEKKNILVMFIDDDAWFPVQTLNYLLECEIKAFSLKTEDPVTNKTFSRVKQESGEIKGWHLIHDIVSICLVVPLQELVKGNMYFNERLGLGSNITQGEESLFIYELSKNGTKIYYDKHVIYHPYKKTFNMKNFYSMGYFWAFGFSNISPIFFVPLVKYAIKYTIALGLFFKDCRYPEITMNVWKGIIDGIWDKENVLQ